MLSPEIKNLDSQAKLHLIDEVWQSIEDEINPPQWHQEVLQERLQLIENKKVNFIDIEDL